MQSQGPKDARRCTAAGLARRVAIACTAAFPLLLTACAEETFHGYVVSEQAVSQVQTGSSREQVLLVLGSPSTTATVGGEAFYYISQKTSRPVAFMEPTVKDQRVLAVYFDDKSRVREVANYGLQDGKVFDFISRRTKTAGQDYGFLSQLLRAGPALGMGQ
ncbi:outer membrane protein assembly factor BamE [Prosthecomicrobium sp. N25]|uniref:outer membrane protein assembly factor BamE n=1 Tax=Prosthecomicrobium sp. N25 TaxID=3129254 RepID=UPI003076FB3C